MDNDTVRALTVSFAAGILAWLTLASLVGFCCWLGGLPFWRSFWWWSFLGPIGLIICTIISVMEEKRARYPRYPRHGRFVPPKVENFEELTEENSKPPSRYETRRNIRRRLRR